MVRTLTLLSIVVAAGLAAGCGSNTSTPTNPDTTTPVVISETFSGTVTVNGAYTQPFTVGRAGQVTVELTALSPDDTVTIGLALGAWNGSACEIRIAKDDAKLASVVVGQTSAAGQLCVRLFDVGRLTRATSYDVKVDHY